MTRYVPPQGEEAPLGSFYMGRMQPPEPPPRRKLPKGLVTAVVVLAFAAIIWYAYPEGNEKYDITDIPVVAADTSPYKFKPEDPGGLEVLHQDSTVFNPIEKRGNDSVETLMPLPEEPMDKTAAIEAAKTKAPIEATTPQLNLDMQMQPLGKGLEKIVSKSDAARLPDAAPPKTAAKEEKKPEAKKEEPRKEETKKEESKPAVVKKEATPEVAPAPQGTAPVDAKPVFIRLGSYRNEAGANDDWKKLSGKYPQYLKNLSVRILRTDLGPKGIYYRLEAGKLSEMRAKQVCDAIKVGHSGGCLVIR